jgi:hypothetical protein
MFDVRTRTKVLLLGWWSGKGLGMEGRWSLWRSRQRGLRQTINLSRASAANQYIKPITMADTEDRAPTDTKAEAPQATPADQTAPSTADDIEAPVDVDTEMQTDSSHTMDNSSNAKSAANMDGASDEPPAVPQIETRMPAKKDVALRDFLSKMDEYAPIVSSLSARVATRYTQGHSHLHP